MTPPPTELSGYAVMRGEGRVSFLAYQKPLPEDEFAELVTWVVKQPELGAECRLVWEESNSV